MTNTLASDHDWSTFAGRLKWARNAMGLTQTALSKSVGMSQGAYSQLERGGTGSEKTASLSERLGINAIWLETGQGEPVNQQSIKNHGYAKIRRISVNVRASQPASLLEFEDEDGPPLWFDLEWLIRRGLNPENLLSIVVRGSSMEPTLYDGDMVVFDTSKTEPVDSGAFVINNEGELVVKRITRDGGRWWMDSDNQNRIHFPRKACEEACPIVGEVVYRQSSRI